VLADRALVELALANLVVNAREGAVLGKVIAMEASAIDLDEAEATRLNVRPGRHAAVTVSAEGVDPSLLSGVAGFGAVQRASADPGGSGLGLPTIHGIVEQYGGGVVVREAPGGGWIVRLLLPEVPRDAAQGS
jgi:K+-sensing histidine kinase KdpD